MTIDKTSDGNKLIVKINGRIDASTAPVLEQELKGIYQNAQELVLDFAETEYISSAGLRVLLLAQKSMKQPENIKLIHVSENIMEIFEVTGFSDILTIE